MLSPNLDAIKYFLKTPDWILARPLLPKTCSLTGKKLWLKKHYKVIFVPLSSDYYITMTYWIDRDAGIVWKLKQSL